MKNHIFWRAYENKDFSQATKEFESLTKEEKENTLSALFQQKPNHTMPQMVSVLQRNLLPGKQFWRLSSSMATTQARTATQLPRAV